MSFTSSITEDARRIWQAGVAAVDAGLRMKQFVAIDQKGISFGDETIPHSEYRNIVVVGAGKSAGAMAAALDEILNSLPAGKQVVGQINVPDNRDLSLKRIRVVGCRPVGVNLPTARVLTSTNSIFELLNQSEPADLVIALFSGGGSALLERPVEGVSLIDLQKVTSYLSRQGASIEELNCVRSQLSLVKGGGLARIIRCRKVVTLLISDVLGDPIEAIASGPTWIPEQANPQPQTANDVIARYARHPDSIPDSIHQVLSSAKKQDHSSHRHRPEVKHFVIANNQVAVQAAFAKAISLGYQGSCETDFSSARAELVAQQLMERLKLALRQTSPESLRGCFISGGEPTVLVENSAGLGGRNQHLVLAAMEIVLSNAADFVGGRFSFLSAGTDGEDGNVAVAGAQFDSEQFDSEQFDSEQFRGLRIPEAAKLAQQFLRDANSYALLNQWSSLFRSEDTNTNVCDLRVLLWEAKS